MLDFLARFLDFIFDLLFLRWMDDLYERHKVLWYLIEGASLALWAGLAAFAFVSGHPIAGVFLLLLALLFLWLLFRVLRAPARPRRGWNSYFDNQHDKRRKKR